MINLKVPPDWGVPEDEEADGLGEAAVEVGSTTAVEEDGGGATFVVAAGGLEDGALDEGGGVVVGELQATKAKLTVTKTASIRKNLVFTFFSFYSIFLVSLNHDTACSRRKNEWI